MTRAPPPSSSDGATDATVVDAPDTGLDPGAAADLQRLRDLSVLLDDSIRVPGTRFRIGIEPLIGLLPVVGDAFGVAVAAYALSVAVRTGVPRATLARIAAVYWLDAVVGGVPLLGDLFDAYWKANSRTVALLDARLADPTTASADRRYLWRMGFVGVFLCAAAVAVLAGLVWWVAGAI
ncbi:MAG: DUF4112 domain-containing protein [Haloplanus sp.]